MGYVLRDKLTDNGSKTEDFYAPFYNNTLKRDRVLRILRVLHLENVAKEINKGDENNYSLRKMGIF
jgi:hypothetical protein